jgi:hypothetical protein
MLLFFVGSVWRTRRREGKKKRGRMRQTSYSFVTRTAPGWRGSRDESNTTVEALV